MKSVGIAWAIFAIHTAGYANEDEFLKLTAVDRLKIECGYDLGEQMVGSIISGEVKEGDFNSEKYINFNFQIDLKLLQKKTTGSISFNCILNEPSAKYENSLTPAQLIQQEDAGGRYFRNIAWQRKISGRNWSGLIAYSDYLFGDGQKSLTYNYLICPAALQCFSFEIDPKIKLTSKERGVALSLIKKISFDN